MLSVIALIATSTNVFYKTFNPPITSAAIEIEPEIKVNGTTVETGNNHLGETKIATDQSGNSVVVWAATNSVGDSRIFIRRFDNTGTPLNDATELIPTQTGYQRTPDIAMDKEGRFAITWEVTGTSNDTLGVWMAAFMANGSQIDNRKLVQSDASSPAITAQYEPAGTITAFAISYTSIISQEDIEFSVYDINFNLMVENNISFIRETTVTSATGQQLFSDIAMNSTEKVAVTWNDRVDNHIKYIVYENDGSILLAQGNVSSAAVETNALTAIAADKAPPILGIDNHFIIAYDGLFESGTIDSIGVRIIECTTTCALNPTLLIANDEPTETPAYPDISTDYLGNFTVVWEHPTFNTVPALTDLDIRGQSYKHDGKTIGINFEINTSITSGYQRFPAISLNDSGKYNITFSDTDNTDMYQSLYNTELFKVGYETLANSVTTAQQDSADSNISKSSLVATTWKDLNDNTIKFTLKDMSENILAQNVTVASGVNVSHPKVSFFKDIAGDHVDYFIIVWENTNVADKDIFYSIYDSSGTLVTPATVLNQTVTDDQTKPAVSAGFYPYFTAAWLDSTTAVKASFYDGTSYLEQTLTTCALMTSCSNISVNLNPTNNYIIYSFEKNNDGSDIFAQQAKYDSGSLTLQGSNFEVDGTKRGSTPDVDFVANNQIIITYADMDTGQSIWASRYNFALGSTPTLVDEFEITPTIYQTTYPTNPRIAGVLGAGDFIIVWSDEPTEPTDDNIYGVFYEYIDTVTTPVQHGPIFQINSTITGNQTIPSVGMNEEGHTIVGWEGNVDQPGNTDTYGIATQTIHSPFITLTADELATFCEQQVTSGIRTLITPDTIRLPIVAVSTTSDQTNQISIRAQDNGLCGNIGDTFLPCGGQGIKYIEITDESGQDFDLTITASDFISASDQKSYIKADQHFRIRNFDQDFDILKDNEIINPACATDPDKCFEITECSIPELTTFSLDSSTETFVSLDQNRTLAVKRGTIENPAEVGTWRIYPEFELTIPKIIPTGNHVGTITFTIN